MTPIESASYAAVDGDMLINGFMIDETQDAFVEDTEHIYNDYDFLTDAELDTQFFGQYYNMLVYAPIVLEHCETGEQVVFYAAGCYADTVFMLIDYDAKPAGIISVRENNTCYDDNESPDTFLSTFDYLNDDSGYYLIIGVGTT